MSNIVDIWAREILDSRGNPTVECDILLESGALGRASVPSGASTGSKEAMELRDNDKKRFNGKGTMKAVSHINKEISDHIIGLDAANQIELDDILIRLDGTDNKSRLGANAILPVSLAVARAMADEVGLPLYRYIGGTGPFSLPVPMMNVINGGAHANNGLDIQEFMLVPTGFSSFKEALRAGCEIFHALKTILDQKNCSTAVGDEGGFAPELASHELALELMSEATEQAGYHAGKEIFFALDCAASEFYQNGVYSLSSKQRTFDAVQLIDYLTNLLEQFPIISIEDAMAENDHQGWQLLTQRLGQRVQLVGDDIFVTNPSILSAGIAAGLANAVLVKVNQIGTLSETLQTVEIAKRNHYSSIMSHRSGETEDSTIADLAVATNCMQIKTGSLSRSDRLAKYNQLLRIEEELGRCAYYPGNKAFTQFINQQGN